MRRSFSSSLTPVVLAATVALPAGAQEPDQGPPGSPIISSEISVSRESADLQLELEGGRTLLLSLDAAGAVLLNGERIGTYDRRDALDTSWRSLLQEAMDAPTGTLVDVLVGWEPPQEAGSAADRMDRELEASLNTPATPPSPAAPEAPAEAQADAARDPSDSITRLNERIRELERLLEDPAAFEDLDRLESLDVPALRGLRRELERSLRDQIREEMRIEIRSGAHDWRDSWRSPWRHITRGIAGVFSTLMVYAILVGVGFLAVFFGRTYLEGIADTARTATLRSGLVGLAGSFLVLPAFILGALALTISIVGIPLLLVFLPLFPLAVVLAALGGYLAVAHAGGEALAERRFTGSDWFTRANSYYYVITGVGLLLVLFIASHIIGMAGPWLGFLQGLLKFLAVMLTWVAFTVGFGAVLISRAGTRPVKEEGLAAGSDTFGEEPRV